MIRILILNPSRYWFLSSCWCFNNNCMLKNLNPFVFPACVQYLFLVSLAHRIFIFFIKFFSAVYLLNFMNPTKPFYFCNIWHPLLILSLLMYLSMKHPIPDIAIHLFQEVFSSTGFPWGKLHSLLCYLSTFHLAVVSPAVFERQYQFMSNHRVW